MLENHRQGEGGLLLHADPAASAAGAGPAPQQSLTLQEQLQKLLFPGGSVKSSSPALASFGGIAATKDLAESNASLESMLKMINGSIYPTPASQIAIDAHQATSAGSPDHFQAFVNSPHAPSSPRSPISTRDFSPELISRDYSPEIDAGSEGDDARFLMDLAGGDSFDVDPDTTLIQSENATYTQNIKAEAFAPEEDWTQFLSSSAVFVDSQQARKQEQGNTPSALHLSIDNTDYFTKAKNFFDENSVAVLSPLPMAEEQQPATSLSSYSQHGEAHAVTNAAAPSTAVSSPTSLDPPSTNIFGVGPEGGISAYVLNNVAQRQRSIDRSSSTSSISSSVSSLCGGMLTTSVDNNSAEMPLYGFGSTPSTSVDSSLSPPALAALALSVRSKQESPATSPYASAAHDSMMASAARTVYNLILDGYPPETIDEFNQKLFAVTGQLVPMRVILEAQQRRHEKLWTASNAGSGSSASEASGAEDAGNSQNSSSDSDSDYADGYHSTRARQRGHNPLVSNNHGASVNTSIKNESSVSNHGFNGTATHRPRSSTSKAIKRGPVGTAVATRPLPSSSVAAHTPAAALATAHHRRGHAARRRFACSDCGKSFDRAFNLKTHMTTHETVRDKPYVCPFEECGKDFARKHDCQRHFKTVHVKRGEAPLAMLDLIVNAHEDEDEGQEEEKMSFA